MKREKGIVWAVRVSWPLLGALCGAWLGFGGYLRLPENADSFGTVLALGFFAFAGWLGLLVGLAAGALIGGVAEMLLRRIGIGTASALGAATLLNALALWQIGVAVQARYPGLRPPAARPAASATIEALPDNPCAHPPAENSRERALWEAECR